MSSGVPDSPAAAVPPRPTTAGGLLRQARQAQGLHIAALAAAIKVVPRKLELLEADRFDELPDATFTRALALTVCRTLKVDPAPILALLPPPKGHRLEQVAVGLNTPFDDRPGRLAPKEWASATNPLTWVAALLVLAAAAVYLIPAGWLPFPTAAVPRAPSGGAPASAAPATTEPASIAPPPGAASAATAQEAASSAAAAAAPPAIAATPPASAATPSASAPPATELLRLHATAPSWIEVLDANGQTLLARLVQPGEDVGIDGVMPLKLKIGNAGGTQVVFRGRPVELGAFTRDNVARFELK